MLVAMISQGLLKTPPGEPIEARRTSFFSIEFDWEVRLKQSDYI